MGVNIGDKVKYLRDGWFEKGKKLFIVGINEIDRLYVLSPFKDSHHDDIYSLWVRRHEFEVISEADEYSEYGRSPLDDYSIGELQAEIERRQSVESKKRRLEQALSDINDHESEVTSEIESLHKTIYTIEVKKL